MIKIIFEGQTEINFSSDVLMTAGQLVKLDTANPGKILVAGAGEDVFGFVNANVVEGNVDNFKLNSVTHTATKGVDKVGVYFNGGIYKTDQYTGSVTVGAKLYAGAGGKLSTTVSGNVVAIAESAGTAPALIRIKSLIG